MCLDEAPSPQRLLIVDDDPVIRRILGDFLCDEGFGVLAVATLDEAVAALAASRFGLVLTDAFRFRHRPDDDLWTGLERLLAAAGTTPVVIFSAQRAIPFDDYYARGVAGIVAKPFDLEMLSAVIRRALSGRRPV